MHHHRRCLREQTRCQSCAGVVGSRAGARGRADRARKARISRSANGQVASMDQRRWGISARVLLICVAVMRLCWRKASTKSAVVMGLTLIGPRLCSFVASRPVTNGSGKPGIESVPPGPVDVSMCIYIRVTDERVPRTDGRRARVPCRLHLSWGRRAANEILDLNSITALVHTNAHDIDIYKVRAIAHRHPLSCLYLHTKHAKKRLISPHQSSIPNGPSSSVSFVRNWSQCAQ